MNCPACNSEMKVSRSHHPYTESGLPDVVLVDVEVRTCKKCGETETVIPRLAQLHRVIAGLVAEKAQRLMGTEIRFLRKHLGWSAEEFAQTMGVRPETVSRWENHKEPMGATAERLLRLMALRERPIESYPNECLAGVAQGEAEPIRVSLMAAKSGWKEAEAA